MACAPSIATMSSLPVDAQLDSSPRFSISALADKPKIFVGKSIEVCGVIDGPTSAGRLVASIGSGSVPNTRGRRDKLF